MADGRWPMFRGFYELKEMVIEEDAWNEEGVVRMFTLENEKGRYAMDGQHARIAYLNR